MDKLDLLLHAVDHPEDFTSEELLAILSDPEIKDAYCLLVDTRSALSPHNDIDVDEEWTDFSSRKISRVRRRMSFIARHSVAAAVIGMLTLGAAAAVIGVSLSRTENSISHSDHSEANPSTEITNILTSDTAGSDSLAITKSTIITFENTYLSDILTEISKYYNVKVVFASDTSKHLRLFFKWNRTLSANEVVRLLDKFDRISLSISEDVITVK